MGKLLIIIGSVLIIIGLLLHFGIRIPLGSLPGDIKIERENFSFYFPLTSSILVSILLTLIVYLWQKLR
jgi:hypothetical protein